jgi:hypothetical protein
MGRNPGGAVREAVIIGVVIGAFFCAVGAILTALAIKFGTDSPLWDLVLWGGAVIMVASVATLGLYISSQVGGRPFMMPSLLINLGICFLTAGVLWHFSRVSHYLVDGDYLYYYVDIVNPRDSNAAIPLWINNESPAPFDNVDPWFSPASAKGNDKDSDYWTIGGQLKVVYPFVRHGKVKYGPAVRPFNFRIEYDATFKGVSYHFIELLARIMHEA